MAVTPSRVLDFIDHNRPFVIERREIHSPVFSTLRKSIRSMITRLREGDETDSQEVADGLRAHLSEWLTVPIAFDGALLESMSALGDADGVEMRWGVEIRRAYDLACEAALTIQSVENPARAQVRDIVQQLRMQENIWRIYCHRRSRVHFESIFEHEPLTADLFLHSVRDYREAEPFQTLIKVGPLRSRGWGSAPDALLSAPRFATLVQIVWSGCADEEDFGYDPVSRGATGTGATAARPADQQIVRGALSWTRDVDHYGDSSDSGLSGPDLDDLAFFHELSRSTELRRATLVQVDEEDGILYPPHSQVATFDPSPHIEDPIGYRLPGETLTEDMFIIWPLLGAADLGALRTGEGHYSRIWKERLRDTFKYTPEDLLRRLREGGIELRNLRYCVRQWCRPPSTVIHAPQQRRHFEILIGVLGIDHEASETSHALRRQWWEYAWSEIARARGEAIQTGMQEHEIIDEQLFVILSELLPEIRTQAKTQSVFEVEISPDKPLQGGVRFYKVRSVEEGFLAPEAILKVVTDLDTVEQWRV
jgi:hypothetical protein